MKISEIIQRVESTLVSGLPEHFRHGYISHRWIYSVLKSMRSRILIQKKNKKQQISAWNKQTITCIPLIDVNANECECYTLNVCTIKRTEKKIPEVLIGLSDYMIDSIFIENRKIDIVSKSEVKYQAYSRFTKNKTQAFFDNGYIYIINGDFLDFINITAVFNDPVEVEKYNAENACNDEEDNKCYNIYEYDFPLDDDLSDACIMMSIQEISMAFLKQNRQQEEEQQQKEE